MAVFAMLASVMFVSKIVMEPLPNLHLLGTLTMTYTLVYRWKALIPIYLYVLLNGLYAGFQIWWIPYLYVWTILWGVTMLLPRQMPPKIAIPVYVTVCGLHGILFGVLYAPVQALFFGFSWKQMLAWIAAGFPFDVIHGIGNCVMGLLIIPLSKTLAKLEHRTSL
jgi:energy-coupling factor transport system substrate-specific component